jgi:hypothetical protein
MIGALLPATEVQLVLGTAKFTTGRLAVALLIIPAIVAICKTGRQAMAADAFVFAMAVWITAAGYVAGDPNSMSSSIAEMIEFCGGYLVARAFFLGLWQLARFLMS